MAGNYEQFDVESSMTKRRNHYVDILIILNQIILNQIYASCQFTFFL